MSQDTTIFEVPVGLEGHIVSLRVGEKGAYLLLMQGMMSTCTMLDSEVSKKLEGLAK